MRALAILGLLVAVSGVTLATNAQDDGGQDTSQCEQDLRTMKKTVLQLKSTIYLLKEEIAKLPYGSKPGKSHGKFVTT